MDELVDWGGERVDSRVEYLPDEVLRGDDAGGDCVAEGVQLDSLVGFEVLFAKEDIEIGVFLD